MKRLIFFISILWSLSLGATEIYPFSDDAEEQRYRDLIAELRCVVCQNQSLAESDADLARDLRREVFEQVQTGASDETIKEFLASRYGDFVLYRPPVKPTTYALWFAPFLFLAGGAIIAVTYFRRHDNESTE